MIKTIKQNNWTLTFNAQDSKITRTINLPIGQIVRWQGVNKHWEHGIYLNSPEHPLTLVSSNKICAGGIWETISEQWRTNDGRIVNRVLLSSGKWDYHVK